MKNFCIWILACLVLMLVACEEDSTGPKTMAPNLGTLELSGWTVESKDEDSHTISISPSKKWLDSIVIDSVEALGDAKLYLAADDDLYDPELGKELVSGTVISTVDTSEFSIIVLDKKNRIVVVWLVSWDSPSVIASSSSNAIASEASQSSSSEMALSSSSARKDSSSSSSRQSSSSETVLSSSSSHKDSSSSSSQQSSSSETVLSSSSARKDSSSSSSWQSSSSEMAQLTLADLQPIVNGDTLKNAVTVNGEKILINVPYSSSLGNALSQVRFVGMDSVLDLRTAKTLNLLSADSLWTAYRVIAGVQVLGSDFTKREDAFFATTSDAMATEGSVQVVANYTFTATANLVENGESISLSSEIVSCAWAGILGAKKLATGIYFAGTYAGQNAMNIYDVNYTSGTPSTDLSDISSQMTFGREFTARPSAFELTYSYVHVANSNSSYPQKALAYVILVSKDSKAVAIGAFTLDASAEGTSTTELSYGADPDAVLSAGYVGTSDLTLGTGREDVASIRVVFASSAYAHVVAGGTTVMNDPAIEYRGGEGSTLTLENWKLIYE